MTDRPDSPDEFATVVCIRLDSATTDLVVDGSTLRYCSECRCEVWISPSSKNFIQGKPHTLICVECASEAPQDAESVFMLAPGAQEEIYECLGRADALDLLQLLARIKQDTMKETKEQLEPTSTPGDEHDQPE